MKLNNLMSASASETLAPERLHDWLASLPMDRPGIAAQALINELARLKPVNCRSRTKLHEACIDTTIKLVRDVEKKLADSPLPLEQELQLIFIATNALLKALAAGFAGIADEIRQKWIGIGYARPLRVSVVRALQFQALRLDLAYRVYARGSRSAWSELHRLYQIARKGGFAAHKPHGLAQGAEPLYVGALLLDFAEPTKLAPGELEHVRFYIERHVRFAHLQDAHADDRQKTTARFLVKPDEARSGRALARSAKVAIDAQDMILDCTALLERMQKQIDGLEQGIEPVRLGLPLVARQPGYLALLRNLHALWSAPPMRRFSRQKFKPRIDLVIGFDALWTYLAGPANRRRTDELPVKINTSEWVIGNESPGGFSLQYVAGNAARVRVGELVGLRPRDQSVVHVCLTRRVVTGDLQSLELGVQNLAPGGTPTMVSVESTDRKGRTQTRAVRVIVLPRLPAAENGPALIAPPQTLQPGASVYLQQRNGPLRLLVSRPVEQCPGCEVFALTPHPASMPRQASAA